MKRPQSRAEYPRGRDHRAQCPGRGSAAEQSVLLVPKLLRYSSINGCRHGCRSAALPLGLRPRLRERPRQDTLLPRKLLLPSQQHSCLHQMRLECSICLRSCQRGRELGP